MHVLTGMYYNWALNILKNANKKKSKGNEVEIDKNQDEIANVHIAVNSYNYLNILKSVSVKFEARHDLKIKYKNSTKEK